MTGKLRHTEMDVRALTRAVAEGVIPKLLWAMYKTDDPHLAEAIRSFLEDHVVDGKFRRLEIRPFDPFF
jgi:hypothetical protein